MWIRLKIPTNLIVFLTFIINALLTQFSIYLYLPSMPAMKVALHTNNAHIQLTYSYFMLGMGLAIVFSGYLIKKSSYRQLLLINNLIFILATVLIFFYRKYLNFFNFTGNSRYRLFFRISIYNYGYY